MFRQRETNPHFHARRDDPIIEFPLQRAPRSRSKTPPPPRGQSRTSVDPPHGHIRPQPQAHHPQPQQKPPQSNQVDNSTQVPDQGFGPYFTAGSVQPQLVVPLQSQHYSGSGSRTPPPPHRQTRTSVDPSHGHIVPQHRSSQPYQADAPPQVPNQEPGPHFTPVQHQSPVRPRGQHHRPYPSSLLQVPTSRKTKPFAWLVAAVCALFWTIIIVGGLVVLIVYLMFRPRNPRFDLSAATLNAAYLDMGYLLNADITLLANFTNPNTKVNVDFTYIILDLYYEKNFVATRYIEPFSVARRESRFANVPVVASQVRLDMAHSLELQRQMERGRVNFEIRGLFRTRSKLGGLFQYSYWLYAHCQITVSDPPGGVLIRKRCVTKR